MFEILTDFEMCNNKLSFDVNGGMFQIMQNGCWIRDFTVCDSRCEYINVPRNAAEPVKIIRFQQPVAS